MTSFSQRFALVLFLTPHLLAAENRSYDGIGNNRQHLQWGSAGTAFQRLGTARYADGMGMLDEVDRPNPRSVSNRMAAQDSPSMNRRGLSDLVWCWGQFLDHDITLSLQNPAEPIPVMVEGPDSLAPMIPVTRTFFDPSTGSSRDNPRQQINNTTAFIDASNVYGTTEERANSLRAFQGGKLIASTNDTIPLNQALIEMENPNGLPLASLYMAGDVRANENPALISMHSLWLREHNRWAEQIAAENPGWGDELIFQKVRKIVGGEIQAITYNEFLVALLGDRAPTLDGARYDPDLNPGMFNEVVAGLFRIGHTMISSDLMLMDDTGAVIPGSNFRFMDVFFRPSFVADRNFVGNLLKGLASKRMQEIDPMVIHDLRNALFGPPGQGGMDLITLNLQRGRDHGLPTYNETRESLGLERVSSFSQITSNSAFRQTLEEVYGSVDQVDLWIGAMAEDHLPGANVGELLATGLALQFRNLRDGDRFFFLFDDALTAEEKQRIADTSLADVIMRNSEMTTLQELAFFAPGQIDSDGDGATDADENIAGTDPVNPLSRFRITGYSRNDEKFGIRWSSVPGRSYSIQHRQTLTGGDSWRDIGRLEASTTQSQFEMNVGTDRTPGGFYRVLVDE